VRDKEPVSIVVVTEIISAICV